MDHSGRQVKVWKSVSAGFVKQNAEADYTRFTEAYARIQRLFVENRAELVKSNKHPKTIHSRLISLSIYLLGKHH